MTYALPVPIQILPHGEGLSVPGYATDGAVGMDLYAAVPAGYPVIVSPGYRKLIPCGFRIELPTGFELQIRPRSGLALKHGIMVLNSPGTIDWDFRGEIQVLLFNTDANAPFYVERGMRIAQAVLASVWRAKLVLDTELHETARGEGGFGSTGVGA
jgi:dUTP pyrophosphatase